MLSKRQMETAVQWWGEKVRGGATHNNGADTFQSFMAMMMADSLTKPQDDDKVEKFQLLLRGALLTEFNFRRHDYIHLGCDYGPDRILSECAEKAGIDELNFPWKTTMTFNNGGVQVSEGYGAPYEDLKLADTSLNKDDILRMIKFISPSVFQCQFGSFIISYKAALVLYGIYDTTKDIDICTSKEIAGKIIENFNFKTSPSPGYDGSTTRITISEDIEMFDNSTFKDHDTIIKTFGNFNIQIDTPEQILKLYKAMNREKDQETIKRIEEYLKEKEN
ncbi:MAG: hypothetical protein NC548_15960 [Lachnospiraceae bacterium]|nr:hypothetical protein [Lachnospiraceae bacterium]